MTLTIAGWRARRALRAIPEGMRLPIKTLLVDPCAPHGWRLTHFAGSPEVMGSFAVELRRGPSRLSVVNDRGQIWARLDGGAGQSKLDEALEARANAESQRLRKIETYAISEREKGVLRADVRRRYVAESLKAAARVAQDSA